MENQYQKFFFKNILLLIGFFIVCLALIYVYINRKQKDKICEIDIRKRGQFGNNIKQIKHGVELGLQIGNKKIKFEDDTIYLSQSKKPVNVVKDFDFISKLNKDGKNYYYKNKLKSIYQDYDESNVDKHQVRDIIVKYVSDKYNFNRKTHSNDNMCIHIRSGDIFNPHKRKVHPKYVQPPYDFYKMILDLEKFKGKQVKLVAEDNKNPVIDKILKNYKNVSWSKNTLKQDQEIIMNSKYIVCGFGTFVPELLYLSNGEKNVISFRDSKIEINRYNNGFEDTQYLTRCDVDINNYIKTWTNTDKQHDIMLNFSIKNNCDRTELDELFNKFVSFR